MRTLIIAGCIALGCLPYFCGAQDPSLELMNNRERMDFIKNREVLSPRVIIRDSTGAVLRDFNLRFPVIGGELYSGIDYYRNASGKVAEVRVRLPRAADFELNRKLFDLEEAQQRGSMEPARADCADPRKFLAGIYQEEEVNRKNEQVLDVEADNVLEAKVIAFLQQCGTPTFQQAGADGIRVIYLVLLHARRKNQEKFRYVLDDFLKASYLQKGTIAALEDKLLIAEGKKQRYGTQIVFFIKTGYTLFPCEEPQQLDARRASQELPPIEVYLRQREEFYGAEIDRLF